MKLWDRLESLPATESRSRLLGMLLMCTVALSWAGIEFLGSHIPSGYSPYQTVWVRYGTHLILMVLILGRSEGWRMVRTTRLKDQVFRSLLMLGMPFCFIAAIGHGINVNLVWAIMWISTPMMMLMAAVMLHESISRAQWIAAGAGLVGTWLLINPSWPGLKWTLVFPVGLAFCYALYKVRTRAMRTEHLSTNLFHTALWVFIPLTFVMPSVWRTPSPKVALVMMGIGAWGFVVLLLLDRALAMAPASLTAPLIYTQCIWSAALLYSTRGIEPNAPGLVGVFLIVGTCVWIFATERIKFQQNIRTTPTP